MTPIQSMRSLNTPIGSLNTRIRAGHCRKIVLLAAACLCTGLGGAQTQTSPAAASEMSPAMARRLARLPKSARDSAQMTGKVPGQDFTLLFDKRVADIRMRDGVTLHTEIYSPKTSGKPLPIIYERTPYGLSHDARGYSANLRMFPELIADGYIFALQDSRGQIGRAHV